MPSTERLDALRTHTAAPAKRPRRRPVAAIALVAALAIAWLAFARGHASPGAAAPPDATTEPPSEHAPDTSALRAQLHLDPSTCVDLVADVAAVSCTIAGVHVDAKLVGVDATTKAYVAATGARLAPATGSPACAHGDEDERSWSRPSTPSVPAGRYTCRHEAGAAAMWWTDEHGVLAHATGGTGDLAQLFAWWRGHALG